MGVVVICVLFWFCSLRIGILDSFDSSTNNDGKGSYYFHDIASRPHNPMRPSLDSDFLNIGGLSGSTDDYPLFCANVAGLLVSSALWGQLVWFATNPGAIDTRDRDFDVVSLFTFLSFSPCLSFLFPIPIPIFFVDFLHSFICTVVYFSYMCVFVYLLSCFLISNFHTQLLSLPVTILMMRYEVSRGNNLLSDQISNESKLIILEIFCSILYDCIE